MTTEVKMRPVTLIDDNAPWPTENGQKIHWRDMFKVHPAAALFPMLEPDQLQELANDIKANGLQEATVFWTDKDGTLYLIDGINRAEASMMADINPGFVNGTAGWFPSQSTILKTDEDPVALVISANLMRRHLSKKQQADLIVAVRAAEVKNIDQAKMARSKIGGAIDGKKGGSTKDPIKEKIMKDAAKAGISERTTKRAMRDHKAKTTAGKLSDIDKPKAKKKVTPKEDLTIAAQVNKKVESFVKTINKIEGVTKQHKKNAIRNMMEEWSIEGEV